MIKINIQKKLLAESGEMNLSLDLEITKGDFVTIYGESGAGKTSTLRMIAGLFNPDIGSITYNDNVWFDSAQKLNLSPQKRNVGFVFQDYALFPNMTVLENLKFAAKPKIDINFISKLLELTELTELKGRKPFSLSGGQKQRVALVRALVQRPNILLLDEPLSALNEEIRSRLQNYILKLHNEFKLTTILVSHDIPEIFKMSDKVFCIKDGKIFRTGKPEEVFVNDNISGKFKFTGTVLKITKSDVVFIVDILIGRDVVKIISVYENIKNIKVGDKVLVVSKAFNPIIMKLT